MYTPLPLVSIILPCYNVVSFLDQSLSDVLNQTYNNWECILIDDGSIDKTASTLKTWQQKDQRFKYFYQDNQGLSGARNTGLKKAKGDYIYFFDPDDLIDHNTIEDLTSYHIKQPEIDIVIGKNAITEGQNKTIKGYLSHYKKHSTVINNKDKNLLKIAIENDIICVAWNKLYRKSFLEKNNLTFKDAILHEDELWFFETLFHANAIIFNNSATYFYNVANTKSITSEFKIKNITSYLTILKTIESKYLKKLNKGINKQMVGNYIKHLKTKTIVHCYKQLSDTDKIVAKNKICKTFNSIDNSNSNPDLLNRHFNKYHSNFETISSLSIDNQLKYLRYYNSKKLGRKIKKHFLYTLAKYKA